MSGMYAVCWMRWAPGSTPERRAEQVMQEALDALGPAGLSAEAAERWLAIAAYLAGR